MPFVKDGYKPVIKVPEEDESENGFASQEDQAHDLYNFGNVCSESAVHLSDIAADEDLEVILGAKESSKMETDADRHVSLKNASKTALLNVPCDASHTGAAVNHAFCADVKPPSRSPEHYVDTAANSENRDPSEIKNLQENGEDRRCVLSFSDSSEEEKICGDSTEKSKFADSKEKDEITEKDEVTDSEETKEFLEKDWENNERNMVNASPKSNCPHEAPVENKNADKVSEDEDKEKDMQMDIPEEDEDTVCGFGSFRPKWLQRWATPRCYLVIYTVIGILQASYYSYFIATMSTLERRFAFKTKISGVIMLIDEITPLALGSLVGYFGGKANRPRIVALGMFLTALCSLISAMPFFIYGPAQHLVYSNSTGPEVCNLQQKMEECDEDDRPPTLPAVVLLILGKFFKGFGNLAYYVIGLTYLDDITGKKNIPLYIGVSFALRLLGVAAGYLMSTAFLKIYENPFVDPGFGPEDPRWIGAWWMGFLLQGLLLLIFTFPMTLFPRRLPNQRKPNQSSFEHEGLVQKMKGLLVGLKRLWTNEIFIFLGIENICTILGAFGHHMMLPKYMENQFRLSASDASLYSGPPAIIALQISTILGAILVWKVRMSARMVMAGKMTADFVGVILLLILMIPSCPNMNFAGTTAISNGLELQNECNKDCQCTTHVFTPLCGPDGVSTYFSSCHAGCSAYLPEDVYGPEVFANCSCVYDEKETFITVEKMTKGYCVDNSCWTQAVIYIVVLPLFNCITNIFRVGHTLVLLRCIDPQDKTFALGTFEAILCLFGFVPNPVLHGALADSVCLIWESSCGATGNCWVYDTKKFRFLLHGVCAGFGIISALCSMRVFCLSHKIRDLYEEDNEDLPEKQHQTEKPVNDDVLIRKSIGGVESTTL